MNGLLKRISRRTFEFKWSDPMHETFVRLHVPDFVGRDCDVWGDWGPMYTFKLDPSDPVKIAYNGTCYTLDQSTLAVESPMFADERRTFPLYLIITDASKGLKILLFMTPGAGLGKVRITRAGDGLELLNLYINGQTTVGRSNVGDSNG